MNAQDFLGFTAQPKTSAMDFLGLSTPAATERPAPKPTAQDLVSDPFAQPEAPGEANPQLERMLKPSQVIPLGLEGAAAMHYATTDADRLKVAAKYLNRPVSDFFAKDAQVYTKEGAKVGGIGGTTPGEAVGNLATDTAASAMANPTATALNVGTVAAAPFTGGASFSLTANPFVQGAAAGLDELIRTAIGKRVLPRTLGDVPQDFTTGDALRAGATGAGAGALTWGFNRAPGFLQALENAGRAAMEGFPQGLRNILPQRALAGLSPEAVQAGKTAMESSPIPLSLGQATGDAGLLSMEGRLSMLPGSQTIARQAREKQNTAAKDFLHSWAGSQASSTDPAMLGRNVVNAAQTAIQEAKNARSRAAGPLYDLAFLEPETPAGAGPSMKDFVWTGDRWADPKALGLTANAGGAGTPLIDAVNSGRKLDISPIIGGIDEKLNSQGTPEAVRELLKRAKAQLLFKGETKNTPQGLQAAKQGIDALMEGLDPKEAQARAALMGVKNDLMSYMEREIPGFATANGTFREMSEPVNALSDGLVGKVAALGPDAAAKAPGMLFGNTTTPAMVADLRQALGLTPQAWSDAVMGKILQTAQGFKGTANGGPGNFSGQMAKQLGGSDAARDMWRAAMTPTQHQEFSGLLDALAKASRGSSGQSWTFAGAPAVEAMQNATQGPIDNALLSALNIGKLASPARWADLYRERLFQKNAAPLAELLFNPPANWWERLVPVDPASRSGYQAATALPKIAGGGLLSRLLGGM